MLETHLSGRMFVQDTYHWQDKGGRMKRRKQRRKDKGRCYANSSFFFSAFPLFCYFIYLKNHVLKYDWPIESSVHLTSTSLCVWMSENLCNHLCAPGCAPVFIRYLSVFMLSLFRCIYFDLYRHFSS